MPGFLNNPTAETQDLPPEIAKRRNGLMQAIMAIPEDQERGAPADFGGPVYPNPNRVQVSDDTASGIAPTRLPKGVSFQHQNWQGPTPLDASNPPRTELLGPGMQTAAAQNRIEDDTTRHPEGDAGPQRLAQAVRMAGPSTPGQNPPQMLGAANSPSEGGIPNEHLAKLQAQYDQLAAKGHGRSIWANIGLALLSRFGHINLGRMLEEQDAERGAQERSLLTEIEAERRMQEQDTLTGKRLEQQADLQNRGKTITLGDQVRMWNPETQTYDTNLGAAPSSAEDRANIGKTVTVGDEVKQWNPTTQRYDIPVGSAKTKPEKPDTPEQQEIDYYMGKGMSLPEAIRAAAADKQSPERPDAGTWQLQRDEAGNPVMFNSKTGAVKAAPPGIIPKGEKPSADEQRRADLANNMEENLGALEEIAKRRPDLFGKVAGRFTQLRQFTGTSDPDIAKLKAIHEYLGMASVGTHAMRNAQHVGQAADAVMGAFTNSPEATLAAIGAARNSIQTFKQDIENARRGGGAAAQGAPKSAVPSKGPQKSAAPSSGGAKLKDRAAGRVLVEGKDF